MRHNFSGIQAFLVDKHESNSYCATQSIIKSVSSIPTKSNHIVNPKDIILATYTNRFPCTNICQSNLENRIPRKRRRITNARSRTTEGKEKEKENGTSSASKVQSCTPTYFQRSNFDTKIYTTE